MHPRSGLWDRATQPGKTQVRAGAPSPHRLPPLSQRRQQPGPTGPPGARPGQGYTDSGLGVLGQKGWPPGSERDALGSSFLLPDSLPQFPHGPEEVPSGETWGGGRVGEDGVNGTPKARTPPHYRASVASAGCAMQIRCSACCRCRVTRRGAPRSVQGVSQDARPTPAPRGTRGLS